MVLIMVLHHTNIKKITQAGQVLVGLLNGILFPFRSNYTKSNIVCQAYYFPNESLPVAVDFPPNFNFPPVLDIPLKENGVPLPL